MAASFPIPDETSQSPSQDWPETRTPEPESAERVLLIEDDASLREAIRDFLRESGYVVVTARNGVEGVHELMGGDFAVILCDMLMPTLPGDMFYRAVEGINPRLCRRFVFMTGHRGNDNTNDFIRDVNGTVLSKPFRMEELEQTIARIREARLIESCIPFQTPVAPFETPFPKPGSRAQAAPGPTVPEQPIAGPRNSDVRPAPVMAGAPRRAALPVVVEASNSGRNRRFRVCAVVTLALSVAATSALWSWTESLRPLVSVAENDLGAARAEWTAISEQLQEAGKERLRIEAFMNLPKQVAAARDQPGWAQALRNALIKTGAEIHLNVVQARAVPAHPGACEVRIEGIANGRTPRALAEQLRQALEAGLAKQSPVAMTVRFEHLEDEPTPPDAAPDQQRASFTIVATVPPPPEPAPRADTTL